MTTSDVIDNFTVGQTTYTYNNVNQLSSSTNPSQSFTYDNDGNMTKGYTPAGYSYTATYDAENRLKTVTYTVGSITYKTEYSYSGDNFLAEIKKYENTTLVKTIRIVRAGFLPVQERDASNQITREYTWGLDKGGGIGGLLNLKDGTADYSYLYDGKGNVMAMLDSNQAVVASYRYDEFGNRMKKTGTLDQPFQFSTKRYDEQTGLSYYGYRFYNPAIGRWMTRDPLGEAGGINLYGFVGNNAVNLVDPLGLLTEVIIWQPTGWVRSSFGHTSVNINGTTYSFEPAGMKIMPSDKYLAKNAFREGVGMELNITPEQEAIINNYLKNYNKEYGRLTNNCSDTIESGLENLGYEMGTILFPVSLGNRLMDLGIVSNYYFYKATQPKKGTSAPWAAK